MGALVGWTESFICIYGQLLDQRASESCAFHYPMTDGKDREYVWFRMGNAKISLCALPQDCSPRPANWTRNSDGTLNMLSASMCNQKTPRSWLHEAPTQADQPPECNRVRLSCKGGTPTLQNGPREKSRRQSGIPVPSSETWDTRCPSERSGTGL